MSNWVEAELAACQMHDGRHTKRLAQLLARLSERPVSSIPRACHGWAETVAAYRLLDNPDIGWQEILSGHKQATLERIRAQELVWRVQATMFLAYGTTQPKAGRGTVKMKVRDEYLLHPTVALTPSASIEASWGRGGGTDYLSEPAPGSSGHSIVAYPDVWGSLLEAYLQR